MVVVVHRAPGAVRGRIVTAPTDAGASDRAAARARLDAALAQVAHRVPCRPEPSPWWSADAAGRARAATACRPCPVLTKCSAYADAAGEAHGVWGALDRESLTPRERRQRARAAS